MSSGRGFDLIDDSLHDDHRRLTFHVPEDSRFFDGHFVDQRIFPGVGMLGMLDHALGRAGLGAPAAFRRVKFRKVVERGGTFLLDLSPGEEPDERSFRISFEGDPVADGSCLPGAARLDQTFASAEVAMRVDLEELIPHRRPMRLVDDALEMGDALAVIRSRVTDSWPLVKDGRVPGVLLVETLSQTASALIGWERRHEELMGGRGFLVGIRRGRLDAASLPVGLEFVNRVETIQRRNGYAVFRCIARAGDRTICEAEIQALRP